MKKAQRMKKIQFVKVKNETGLKFVRFTEKRNTHYDVFNKTTCLIIKKEREHGKTETYMEKMEGTLFIADSRRYIYFHFQLYTNVWSYYCI